MKETRNYLHITPEQADGKHHHGMMTERAYRQYMTFWVWCAPRMSNIYHADYKQERLFRRHGGGKDGHIAVMTRINRFRRAAGYEQYPTPQGANS